MLLFVAKLDESGTLRKSRMMAPDCPTTTQLLKKICSFCKIQPHSLIAKLKHHPTDLRLIQGWPIQKYPLRRNSQIHIQIIKQTLNNNNEDSPPKQSKKLQQQSQDYKDSTGQTLVSQTQQSCQYQDNNDWTKYLQHQLQNFLNQIRNQSIQNASNILKSQPICNSQKLQNRNRQKKIAFLLNQNGTCGWAALHQAIQVDDYKMVQFLLSQPSDPNVVSQDSHTPLQLSIGLERMKIFTLLLTNPRIDINKVTKKGTALHFAIQYQKQQYAQILLNIGASPQIQNYQGITPSQIYDQLPKQSLKFKAKQKQAVYQIKGILYKLSTFSSLKQRLLLINPFKNQFTLYQGKYYQKQSQKYKITQITSVQFVDTVTWLMKKQYFYFIIHTMKNKITLAVKNQQIRLAWVSGIKKCIRYCQIHQIQYHSISLQFIQVINDNDNQIKLQKNNQQDINNKNKKNFNFDFSFSKDNSNHQLPPPINSINYSQINSQIHSNQPSSIPPQPSHQQTAQNSHNSPSPQHPISLQHTKPYISSKLAQKPRIYFRDFEMLRQLGHGSFGKVFLARHIKQQKFYALKVLNKKKLILKKQMKYAVGQATILKKLDCPFIIKLHYSFQTQANLYIAIDYCPNGDLSSLISQQQSLPQGVCRFYIAQLILAIQYLHKQKILYRDLKPQNILIGADGYIKLTDFNLSKQNNFSTSFCGSSAYLSPEMLEKKGVGLEVDIYGIGCVLYEMLAGVPPYYDQDIKILYQNIRAGKLKFPQQISKSAKNLISSLLERTVSKRLGSKNMNQIKKHQFFSGFEWKQLQNQTMQPPSQISSKFKDKFNQLQIINQHGFCDQDYQKNVNQINKVKYFTFVRDT